MAWDFENQSLGIICADAAFCCTASKQLLRGPWPSTVLGRKGSTEFNTFVIDQIISHGGRIPDKIVVVGEGRSDVRLYEALVSAIPPPRLEYSLSGFFFYNTDLGLSYSISDRCHHFASWDTLAVELGRELSIAANAGARSLILVDVDRTIIYPKGEADDSYADMRLRALRHYISRFRSAPLPMSKSCLDSLSKTVSAGLRDFNNELDEITFRNFELIAVTVLLVCVGLVFKNDISQIGHQAKQQSFRNTVSSASFKLEEGGDLSWIDWAGPGDESRRFAIRDVWDLASLQAHLRDVRDRLALQDPVVCPLYRESECELIDAELEGNPRRVVNGYLMAALRAAKDRNILHVTDRPAASLGITGGEDGRECSSRFWEHVR